ncbi:MAG: hypothetical protein KBT03_01265 [Bacteroidales bacterium]|nr:hypothetical protein [Candidatus Scybalousia scybalohippi]
MKKYEAAELLKEIKYICQHRNGDCGQCYFTYLCKRQIKPKDWRIREIEYEASSLVDHLKGPYPRIPKYNFQNTRLTVNEFVNFIDYNREGLYTLVIQDGNGDPTCEVKTNSPLLERLSDILINSIDNGDTKDSFCIWLQDSEDQKDG